MTLNCPNCGHVLAGTPLTTQQKQLLDFIKKFRAATGVSPTFEAMMKYMCLHSKAPVHRLVLELEGKGAIIRNKYRSQSIVPTEEIARPA